MRLIVFLLLLACFSCKKEEIELPISQDTTCATEHVINPDKEALIQSYLSKKSLSVATIIVPVVVHVVWRDSIQNISDATILQQLEILNKDFNRKNSDTVNTPIPFRNVAAGANIQFCLAKRTPNNQPHSGIIRKYSSTVSWDASGTVKMSSFGGSDAWDCNKYLNIWVCNLQPYLGYATYPGGNPLADGVVVRWSVFGNSNIYPQYNKGRTATHEVGHWLYLHHIFGGTNCNDDLINDTPLQERANNNCPVFPQITCNNSPNGDMFCNYMDYTYDACMNTFTQQQCDRMRACLQLERTPILTSIGCQPVPTVDTIKIKKNNRR